MEALVSLTSRGKPQHEELVDCTRFSKILRQELNDSRKGG